MSRRSKQRAKARRQKQKYQTEYKNVGRGSVGHINPSLHDAATKASSIRGSSKVKIKIKPKTKEETSAVFDETVGTARYFTMESIERGLADSNRE